MADTLHVISDDEDIDSEGIESAVLNDDLIIKKYIYGCE